MQEGYTYKQYHENISAVVSVLGPLPLGPALPPPRPLIEGQQKGPPLSFYFTDFCRNKALRKPWRRELTCPSRPEPSGPYRAAQAWTGPGVRAWVGLAKGK